MRGIPLPEQAVHTYLLDGDVKEVAGFVRLGLGGQLLALASVYTLWSFLAVKPGVQIFAAILVRYSMVATWL
jgi:hypothetical protein